MWLVCVCACVWEMAKVCSGSLSTSWNRAAGGRAGGGRLHYITMQIQDTRGGCKLQHVMCVRVFVCVLHNNLAAT